MYGAQELAVTGGGVGLLGLGISLGWWMVAIIGVGLALLAISKLLRRRKSRP